MLNDYDRINSQEGVADFFVCHALALPVPRRPQNNRASSDGAFIFKARIQSSNNSAGP
jgi:hypothetical protein